MNEITENELMAIRNHIVILTIMRLTEKEINNSSGVRKRLWQSVLAGLHINFTVSRNDLKSFGIWVADKGVKQNDDIIAYRFAKSGYTGMFPFSKQGLKAAVEQMAENIGVRWENAFRQRAKDCEHSI